jgi:hypothetical protein
MGILPRASNVHDLATVLAASEKRQTETINEGHAYLVALKNDPDSDVGRGLLRQQAW